MTRINDIERAALQATGAQLEAMLLSKTPHVSDAAAREKERRQVERREMGSLTGVVRPFDDAA